jgi:hypothetical protein
MKYEIVLEIEVDNENYLSMLDKASMLENVLINKVLSIGGLPKRTSYYVKNKTENNEV